MKRAGWLERRREQLGLAIVLCVSVAAAARGDGPWVEDADEAVRQAAAGKRDMLLLFTGSDWCPPCQKLEQETLSQADFLRQAEKDWLLVKLDFPRARELPPAIAQANERWRSHFGVGGFPTIVVTDSRQRPVGFLGYMEGGPVAMLAELRNLKDRRVQRDDALAAAEKATGDERAALVDRALSLLDEQVARVWYTDLIDQIVLLDPDNRLGLREKWNGERDAEARALVMADIEAVARLDRPERAAAFIDEVLEAVAFPPADQFRILQIQLGLLQQAGQTAAAAKLLEKLLAMPGITETTREALLVRRAWQLQSAGDPEAARKGLEQALAAGDELPLASLALARLYAAAGDSGRALELLRAALPRASRRPDAAIEIVAAMAELHCAAGREEEGLGLLESFASDEQYPVDLRAEALLQAALAMRDAGRLRPAMLTENRAVALARDPELARELQRVVDAIRRKAGGNGGNR